jgi:hypothetical protein
MGEAIHTGDIKLWTERRGQGPDVLLIGCAGSVDTAFAGIFRTWQYRAKRFDTNLTPTRSLINWTTDWVDALGT